MLTGGCESYDIFSVCTKWTPTAQSEKLHMSNLCQSAKCDFSTVLFQYILMLSGGMHNFITVFVDNENIGIFQQKHEIFWVFKCEKYVDISLILSGNLNSKNG